jgi:PKD repeat protein
MKRALFGSGIAAALLAAAGCGGGGSAPGTPPAATSTTTVGSASSTTLTEQGSEDVAPLLAWAEGEPEEGKAPLTIQFKADTEGGKPPLKVSWSFGDGSPDSSEANPKHTYEKPGKYRADLSATDASGDSDTDYVEIEVQ